MEWKDETTYSRDNKERIPSVWGIRFKGFRVAVVNKHRLAPNKWVMHCFALGIDTLDLGVESIQPKEIAQDKAIKHVKTKLHSMVNQINQYLHSQKLKSLQNEQTANE